MLVSTLVCGSVSLIISYANGTKNASTYMYTLQTRVSNRGDEMMLTWLPSCRFATHSTLPFCNALNLPFCNALNLPFCNALHLAVLQRYHRRRWHNVA